MLSLRLIRKLEGLSGEALAHLEAQADLLLAMPEHCRARDIRSLLRIVKPVASTAAMRPAIAALQTTALIGRDAISLKAHARVDESRQWIERSRRLIAALTSTKPSPAKIEAPRPRRASVLRHRVAR